MKAETISKNFERDVLPTLPRWARNDPKVVLGCKYSLSFRCDVFAAKTAQAKRQLKREAQRFELEIVNDDEIGMTVGE